MTDEELIAILRMQGPNLAADRIEALQAGIAAMTPEVRALVEAAEKYLAAREPYDDEDDVVAAAGLGLKDALAALRAGGDA